MVYTFGSKADARRYNPSRSERSIRRDRVYAFCYGCKNFESEKEDKCYFCSLAVGNIDMLNVSDLKGLGCRRKYEVKDSPVTRFDVRLGKYKARHKQMYRIVYENWFALRTSYDESEVEELAHKMENSNTGKFVRIECVGAV